MNVYRLLGVILIFYSTGCSNEDPTSALTNCRDSKTNNDCSTTSANAIYNTAKGALLGTRFKSLEELKCVIQIEYLNDSAVTDSTTHENSKVRVRHCSNGMEVISLLESGISQGDIGNARNGDLWEKLNLLLNSPFAVSNRKELSKVYLLARRRTDIFGEGDPAFYDLAVAAMKNINTPDLAFMTGRDTTEKGYLNSFNHIAAQAFITSCFSEKLADFVGDVHERYFHPELITGKFSEEQIKDLDEGPVDNYVDVVNNEWGQELGKVLKKKYNISQTTYWTPELLKNYLNDLQSYYSWAFQIGFKPVKIQDEVVIRFSNKLNLVMFGEIPIEKT